MKILHSITAASLLFAQLVARAAPIDYRVDFTDGVVNVSGTLTTNGDTGAAFSRSDISYFCLNTPVAPAGLAYFCFVQAVQIQPDSIVVDGAWNDTLLTATDSSLTLNAPASGAAALHFRSFESELALSISADGTWTLFLQASDILGGKQYRSANPQSLPLVIAGVPEPMTTGLLALGLCAAGAARRRRAIGVSGDVDRRDGNASGG